MDTGKKLTRCVSNNSYRALIPDINATISVDAKDRCICRIDEVRKVMFKIGVYDESSFGFIINTAYYFILIVIPMFVGYLQLRIIVLLAHFVVLYIVVATVV